MELAKVRLMKAEEMELAKVRLMKAEEMWRPSSKSTKTKTREGFEETFLWDTALRNTQKDKTPCPDIHLALRN